MKATFAVLFIIIAAMIGTAAIQTVNSLQNDKLSRFCKNAPHSTTYDKMCKDFR